MTYQVPTDGQLNAWAAELNEGAQVGRVGYVLNRSWYPCEGVRLTSDGWFAPRVNGVELIGVHSSELAEHFTFKPTFSAPSKPYEPAERGLL